MNIEKYKFEILKFSPELVVYFFETSHVQAKRQEETILMLKQEIASQKEEIQMMKQDIDFMKEQISRIMNQNHENALPNPLGHSQQTSK